MKLLELSEKQTMTREEAAGVLRELADKLARHNEVEFTRNGIRITANVPAEIELEVELEIESDESSLEIEINW